MSDAAPAGRLAALAADVRAGRRPAADVVRASLDAVRSSTELHAFLSLDPLAPAAAGAVDRLGASGGPLAGIPVAVKDNICTLGLPTTCGSRILEGYRSPYDATVVARLRAAGAVVVGKTNLDEFAMGSTTERSAYGPTRNPHDRDRVPGGSSGGSAAAVAAGLVPVALGTDTAGSVRQPAAHCGVVGLKPTWGRISRYGVVGFAPSLDQVGILGRGVGDVAEVLRVVAGPDRFDATAADRPLPDLAAALGRGARGLVVGVPEEYFPPDLEPSVREPCLEALERLRALGAELRPVSLPHTRYAIPAYHALAAAEASSNLARFDGVRFGRRAEGARSVDALFEATRGSGFGTEVKRRILLGTLLLSDEAGRDRHARAGRVRARVAEDFRRVFDAGVDVLFTPTTPTPAFRLGTAEADPYRSYLADRFTVAANLAGLPAVSVPVGATAGGLPVGGQLIADRWGEAVLLGAAAALERAMAGGGAR